MEKTKSERNAYILRKYLGYGVGAIGMDLSYGLFNSFLNNYLTNVLLIAPFYVGVVAFCARIWDGINDPMMGTIVDNTHTRAGKFRPWILTGSLLNAVVLFFLFTNPGFSVSGSAVNIGLYVYVAVMYVLWGMSYTIVDIPYWSMVPVLTSDPQERNLAATFPRFFSGFGQIIIVVLTVPMLNLFGKGNDAIGFSYWSAICGVLLVLGCLVTFFTTKETVHPKPEHQEKFTLKRAFLTIKNNDQLLIFILTAICFNTGWYLTNGLGIYYFESVLENRDLYSVFGAIGGVGPDSFACALQKVHAQPCHQGGHAPLDHRLSRHGAIRPGAQPVYPVCHLRHCGLHGDRLYVCGGNDHAGGYCGLWRIQARLPDGLHRFLHEKPAVESGLFDSEPDYRRGTTAFAL